LVNPIPELSEQIAKQCISGRIIKDNIFVKNRTEDGRMFLAGEHVWNLSSQGSTNMCNFMLTSFFVIRIS